MRAEYQVQTTESSKGAVKGNGPPTAPDEVTPGTRRGVRSDRRTGTYVESLCQQHVETTESFMSHSKGVL